MILPFKCGILSTENLLVVRNKSRAVNLMVWFLEFRYWIKSIQSQRPLAVDNSRSKARINPFRLELALKQSSAWSEIQAVYSLTHLFHPDIAMMNEHSSLSTHLPR
jgi:hypothetical protein